MVEPNKAKPCSLVIKDGIPVDVVIHDVALVTRRREPGEPPPSPDAAPELSLSINHLLQMFITTAEQADKPEIAYLMMSLLEAASNKAQARLNQPTWPPVC